MDQILEANLLHLLKEKALKAKPKKVLLSKKSALVYATAIYFYQHKKLLTNYFKKHAVEKSDYLPNVIARHQSLLFKKLGDNNEHLQQQKIVNLTQAIKKINTIVIQPGQTFSYWHLIGKPTVKKGYVDGMLLSRGRVVEGVGGGLCQLSNLLYWLFLHASFEIVERFHHSYDVFPDSGRSLPFGSGATVFYNYVDLVVRNISTQPMQLRVWLTDNHLKGQILSNKPAVEKYSVREENHLFLKSGNEYFRYNELFRDKKILGETVKTEFVTRNFAPVLYPTTLEDLKSKGYEVVEME